jgi:hypothetical protein
MLSIEEKGNYQTDWDTIEKAEFYLSVNNCERAVIVDTKENKIVRLFNITQQPLSNIETSDNGERCMKFYSQGYQSENK